jgi:hypothetical protein
VRSYCRCFIFNNILQNNTPPSIHCFQPSMIFSTQFFLPWASWTLPLSFSHIPDDVNKASALRYNKYTPCFHQLIPFPTTQSTFSWISMSIYKQNSHLPFVNKFRLIGCAIDVDDFSPCFTWWNICFNVYFDAGAPDLMLACLTLLINTVI